MCRLCCLGYVLFRQIGLSHIQISWFFLLLIESIMTSKLPYHICLLTVDRKKTKPYMLECIQLSNYSLGMENHFLTDLP